MAQSYIKSPWHGKDNSARDNTRNKKERKTEPEMGRQHKGLESVESVRAVEDRKG